MGFAEYRSEVEIPVPLARAWTILADLDAWPEWNPFVVGIAGGSRPEVGRRFRLDVRWADGGGTRATEEVIEVFEDEARCGWRWTYRGLPARLGLVRGTRVIAVERVSPGSCRYLSGERFVGPLVGLLPFDAICDGFDRMALGFAAACIASAPPPEPYEPTLVRRRAGR